MTKSIYQIIDNIETVLLEVEQLTIKLRARLHKGMMTNAEFEALMNISPNTSFRWRSKRLISYHRIDGKIYYAIIDILSFIINHYYPAKKK